MIINGAIDEQKRNQIKIQDSISFVQKQINQIKISKPQEYIQILDILISQSYETQTIVAFNPLLSDFLQIQISLISQNGANNQKQLIQNLQSQVQSLKNLKTNLNKPQNFPIVLQVQPEINTNIINILQQNEQQYQVEQTMLEGDYQILFQLTLEKIEGKSSDLQEALNNFGQQTQKFELSNEISQSRNGIKEALESQNFEAVNLIIDGVRQMFVQEIKDMQKSQDSNQSLQKLIDEIEQSFENDEIDQNKLNALQTQSSNYFVTKFVQEINMALDKKKEIKAAGILKKLKKTNQDYQKEFSTQLESAIEQEKKLAQAISFIAQKNIEKAIQQLDLTYKLVQSQNIFQVDDEVRQFTFKAQESLNQGNIDQVKLYFNLIANEVCGENSLLPLCTEELALLKQNYEQSQDLTQQNSIQEIKGEEEEEFEEQEEYKDDHLVDQELLDSNVIKEQKMIQEQILKEQNQIKEDQAKQEQKQNSINDSKIQSYPDQIQPIQQNISPIQQVTQQQELVLPTIDEDIIAAQQEQNKIKNRDFLSEYQDLSNLIDAQQPNKLPVLIDQQKLFTQQPVLNDYQKLHQSFSQQQQQNNGLQKIDDKKLVQHLNKQQFLQQDPQNRFNQIKKNQHSTVDPIMAAQADLMIHHNRQKLQKQQTQKIRFAEPKINPYMTAQADMMIKQQNHQKVSKQNSQKIRFAAIDPEPLQQHQPSSQDVVSQNIQNMKQVLIRSDINSKEMQQQLKVYTNRLQQNPSVDQDIVEILKDTIDSDIFDKKICAKLVKKLDRKIQSQNRFKQIDVRNKPRQMTKKIVEKIPKDLFKNLKWKSLNK